MFSPSRPKFMHRLFKLSSNFLETLLTISHADSVVPLPQDDWPLQEAVVVTVSVCSLLHVMIH